jgi:hypothetical protein
LRVAIAGDRAATAATLSLWVETVALHVYAPPLEGVKVVSASRRLATLHEDALRLFESALGKAVPNTEGGAKTEAVRQAVIGLCRLTCSHARGLEKLHTGEVSLGAAAVALSRCVLECGVTAAWLAQPPDPADQFQRWLAFLLHSQERFESGVLKPLGVPPSLGIGPFASWKEARKEARSNKIDHPIFKELLHDFGLAAEAYALYAWACQYTHGSHWAIQQLAEENEAPRWERAFLASSVGLSHAGSIALKWVGAPITAVEELETVLSGVPGLLAQLPR